MTSTDKTPTELLAEAKSRKLTAEERRAVIRHIDEHGYFDDAGNELQEPNNQQLALLFQVDESSIRKDRRKILKEFVDVITPDDAMQFVGEYLFEHDRLIREAKRGLNETARGSLYHMQYTKTLSDLMARKIKMLQDIGALPHELGNLNVRDEVWEAYVADGGATGVRRMVRQAKDGSVEERGEDEVAS